MDNTLHLDKEKDLLLIFTRNPVPGKCKTRLAARVGDQAALTIYKFLLKHTVSITRNLPVTKIVYYSDDIWQNDLWDAGIYRKALQQGTDLGQRMSHAFGAGFARGFKRVIIIGSDLYDLKQEDLENAFHQLSTADYVIGPASDGGYYLLGMKKLNCSIFLNMSWGGTTVLDDTLNRLNKEQVVLLDTRNDIDVYEDIRNNEDFQPFITHLKNDESATG